MTNAIVKITNPFFAVVYEYLNLPMAKIQECLLFAAVYLWQEVLYSLYMIGSSREMKFTCVVPAWGCSHTMHLVCPAVSQGVGRQKVGKSTETR